MMAQMLTANEAESDLLGTEERPLKRRSASLKITIRNLLFTLPFIILFLVQLAHHEMWRDELNAFGIAVGSPGLGSLLHVVHYEGHPWLWYVLLWFVSKATVFPVGMKVLEGCIGTAIYLMIGLASPFRWREKVLLFLSYFICFEYTVISRMYAIVLLLLLVYLWQISRPRPEGAGSFMILGLIASADLTGMILSLALLLERVVRVVWEARPPGTGPEVTDGARRLDQKRGLRNGVLIYAGFLLFSVYSLWPAHDISTRTTSPPFRSAWSISNLSHAVANYTVMPYFPSATASAKTYLNAVAVEHHRAVLLVVPLVLLAYWIVFRGHKSLLVMVAATWVMMIAFGHLIYMGNLRHFGITFLAFVAGIWLIRGGGEALSPVAYLLILLTVIGGVETEVNAWRRPFSNASAAATWLAHSEVSALPLAGSPDSSVIGVAEELHRPMYLLASERSRTFLLFSKERDHFTNADIPERLEAAREALGGPVFVFVDAEPLTRQQVQDLGSRHMDVELLTQFTGAEVQGEDFYIYRLRSNS